MKSTIDNCLSSLERLDYPKNRYEVIVVDGGSTDKTIEIIKKHRVILLQENSRIRGFARNFGIRHAKGSLVAFIDADCIASREWLKFLVEDHLFYPEVGAVGGGVVNKIPRAGKFTILMIADNETEYSTNSPMRYVSPIPTCNASFKKNVIQKIGLFNERLHNGEDTELCHRLGKNGYAILFDPKAFIIHKSESERWTHSDVRRLAEDFIRGGKVYFDIETVQQRQKYRLPRNSFLFFLLFFPIILIRGLKLLYKTRYVMSSKIIDLFPYIGFGSFFWTLGYFKGILNAAHREVGCVTKKRSVIQGDGRFVR